MPRTSDYKRLTTQAGWFLQGLGGNLNVTLRPWFGQSQWVTAGCVKSDRFLWKRIWHIRGTKVWNCPKKNKQTNRIRCQLWMDLSGAFWVLRNIALMCGPYCMPFHQAIIHTQAVNILGLVYCSQTLKEMDHIPKTCFLNFPTLPGFLFPCCWSNIHSILLSTWACIALGSFKKHPGLLSLVLSVLSLPFLVISLGHFECSLWELSGHRFLGQYSCWCQRAIVGCVSNIQTEQLWPCHLLFHMKNLV